MKIAIVGKYTSLLDAYKSLAEALRHGGIANNVKVKLNWIDSEIFEREDTVQHLEGVHGILVPGGFGERGSEGKIKAARFARERKMPVFRHLLRHADGGDRGGAQSGRHQERRLDRVRPLPGAGGRPDDRMGARQRSWRRRKAGGDLGGTMRLGAYECDAEAGQRGRRASTARPRSRERHRHRYEVNINYKDRLEKAGLLFSGMSPDGILPEIVEIPDHPWFIGVQFHPELKSRRSSRIRCSSRSSARP